MAQKYAKKEQDELNMPQTLDESKAYLRKLTEKFFYHEAGHIFYKHFLPDNLKGWWEDFIKGNNQIAQEVIRVQEDKYPSEDEIPVAEEAFTDIFAEVVTEGRTQNRIGHHPEAVEAMETILKQFEKRAG